MAVFVALLRGINVGRAKRVPMAELRSLMATLGYGNISTLLNSGNVIFSAKGGAATRHAGRIRSAVAAEIGVDAPVIVLEAAQFAAAFSENPLLKVATDKSRLLVAFIQDSATLKEVAALTSSNWAPDALGMGKHAAYLWCRNGVLESKLAKAVARQLGDRVTTRNWATAEKIGALLNPDAARGRRSRTTPEGEQP
jgi:uncharacterized protein (DUF1697 family)